MNKYLMLSVTTEKIFISFILSLETLYFYLRHTFYTIDINVFYMQNYKTALVVADDVLAGPRLTA